MLEGRMREYKRGLLDKARPHLGPGEEVRVLALAQARIRPWLQFLPYGIGGVLITGGLFGDTYLPPWMGVVGVVIVIAGAWLGTRIPRRLLIRTDERLYSFELPATAKAPVGQPLGVYELAELPTDPAEDGVPALGGELLYPNYGARDERGAIAKALEPAGPP